MVEGEARHRAVVARVGRWGVGGVCHLERRVVDACGFGLAAGRRDHVWCHIDAMYRTGEPREPPTDDPRAAGSFQPTLGRLGLSALNDCLEDLVRVGDRAGVEGFRLMGEGPLDILCVISPFHLGNTR